MLYGCFVDEVAHQYWGFISVRTLGLELYYWDRILMHTLDRMVMRGDIPYLRIIRLIPREMRDRLPQHYIALLETSVRDLILL